MSHVVGDLEEPKHVDFLFSLTQVEVARLMALFYLYQWLKDGGID